MFKIYENIKLNLQFLKKAMKKFILSVIRKQCFLFFAMVLKTVFFLVTVSVSFLILHQEFYLIKIYHDRPKFTVLRKSDPDYLDQGYVTSGSHKSKSDCILRYV